MEIPRIETLLLQEMEEVKGGRTDICDCKSGAYQSTEDGGICICMSGAVQKAPEKTSVCFCDGGAGQ
jgi:hypothetical protein